eukprot:scpid53982/ scgid16202/ 
MEQMAAPTPTLPRLPTEVWALIFGKLPDGWYYVHHLATVCSQFANVAAGYKGSVCEKTYFDFRRGTGSAKRRFLRLAETCGKYVNQLELVGECFMPSPTPGISTSAVVSVLHLMPKLAVFDCSMCFLGRDITILNALVECQNLRHVRITLAVGESGTASGPDCFAFTDTAMATVVSLAAKSTLEINCVGWCDILNDAGPAIKELLQRIRDNDGKLQSLRVYSCEVEDFAKEFTRSPLCNIPPACIPSGIPRSATWYPAQCLQVNLMYDGFPVDVTTYPYLKCLVLTGDSFVHLRSDELIKILQNNTRITQLSVAVAIDLMLTEDTYDAKFFENFSRLENKFCHLDTSHWRTTAPCDVFVKMAARFPLLRDFSYVYRSHSMDADCTYPRDGSRDSAEALVAACPNLSRLTIGGAIGIPSLDTSRGDYWTGRERIVLRDNFGALTTLGRLSRLQSLSLQGMSLNSETDLETLASELPELECVHLSDIYCEPFDYIPGLGNAISKLRNLKTLILRDSNLQIVDVLESVGELTRLDNFSLHTDTSIPDHTLTAFIDSSQSPLKFVHIVHGDQIYKSGSLSSG